MKTTHHFTLEEVKENLRSYCGLSSDEEIVIEGIDDIQKGPYIVLSAGLGDCWFCDVNFAEKSQYWGLMCEMYPSLAETTYNYFGKGIKGQMIYCDMIEHKYYITPEQWYEKIYTSNDKKPE